jgi:hypothetical protein
MSYNGSGTFQINTSGQPVVTGTSISSTVFNALTADLATGLSTAITKDGQTTTTARIPFALGINSTLVTDATNTTSGSIITAGGVGIAKALYVGTTANVAGLTASSAVATDASKNLVSVTNTGTGNNVLATAPTIASLNLTTALTIASAAGTAGQALTSGGSGNAPTWTTIGATPGGSTTQVQYNNAGAFGGISGVTTDGTRMTASTTIGVGAATPSTSGAGITFPATQSASSDANTLDDYEEGTWTPTFGGSGSDPTSVSYNTQEGTYTKIGNRVFVEFFLSFTTFTGGSNAVAIKGLPFTGSGNGDGAMKIENVSFTAGKTYLVGTISASAVSPQQVGGSPTAWNGLTIGTNVTSSGTTKFFTGSLCYKI